MWGSNQSAHLRVAEALKKTLGMHQESKPTFSAMAVFKLQVRTRFAFSAAALNHCLLTAQAA